MCLAGRLVAIVHVGLDAEEGLANLARDSAVTRITLPHNYTDNVAT